MTMNSGHALIVQNKLFSYLQQQAQQKDAEFCRQQRELQTLRVRTYCYILANTSKNSYARVSSFEESMITTVQFISLWTHYRLLVFSIF